MSFRAERIRIAVPLERQRRLFDFSSSRSLARHAFRLDLQGIASLADAAVLVCFIAAQAQRDAHRAVSSESAQDNGRQRRSGARGRLHEKNGPPPPSSEVLAKILFVPR